ncbi:20932_t:CDS:2, partial [Racocetra persica]
SVIQDRLFYTSLYSRTNTASNDNTIDQLKVQEFAISKYISIQESTILKYTLNIEVISEKIRIIACALIEDKTLETFH